MRTVLIMQLHINLALYSKLSQASVTDLSAKLNDASRPLFVSVRLAQRFHSRHKVAKNQTSVFSKGSSKKLVEAIPKSLTRDKK